MTNPPTRRFKIGDIVQLRPTRKRDIKWDLVIVRIIHVCPDWYIRGVPYPEYKIERVNKIAESTECQRSAITGERYDRNTQTWWIDEGDMVPLTPETGEGYREHRPSFHEAVINSMLNTGEDYSL